MHETDPTCLDGVVAVNVYVCVFRVLLVVFRAAYRCLTALVVIHEQLFTVANDADAPPFRLESHELLPRLHSSLGLHG